MSLAPTASATIGSLRYDAHVSTVRATLSLLPAVNSVTLSLPLAVKFTAVPGDDAVLLLHGGDVEGDGEQTVLTGKVRQVRRTFEAIEITCTDAGVDLAALRPAKTYQNQSAADVIEALAQEAGVEVGDVDVDLDLAAYVAHQRRTAAEHIAYLASLGGSIARVSGEGGLEVIPTPGEQAERALLYGRELVEYQRIDGPSVAVQRVAVGNGPSSSPAAPDALKPTLTKVPEDAATPGKDAIWYPTPVLRAPKPAVAASEALNNRATALMQRMRARCFLLTALRPGMVVEIQELPDQLGGSNWLLTRVTHGVRPGVGGETVLEGVLAGASGSSLLGSLLGAIGGLL